MRVSEARQLFVGVIVLVAGIQSIVYTHEWIAAKTGYSESFTLCISGIALFATVRSILR